MRWLFVVAGSALAVGACTLTRSGALDEQPTGSEATTMAGPTSGGGEGEQGGGQVGPGGSGQGGDVSVGGSGGTGGSGGAGPEDCLDGIDNNGDGAVDCEDPLCADHLCAAEIPSDWAGVYRVARHPATDPDLGLCPDGTTVPDRFVGDLSTDPAECTTCSCGALQGAACSNPTLRMHQNSDTCNNLFASLFVPNLGTCGNFGSNFTCNQSCSNDYHAEMVPSAVAGNPGCPAAGGEASITTPAANSVLEACLEPLAGDGCDGGCLEPGGVDFDRVCIRRDGVHDCPAGWADQDIVYASVEDNRGCETCTCEPSAACTSGSLTIYNHNGCVAGGEPNPVNVAPNACVDISEHIDFGDGSMEVAPGTLSGSCTTAGGSPTGQVDGVEPMTYCCLPMPSPN